MILTPFDSVGNKCGALGQQVEAAYVESVGALNATDYTEFPYKMFTNINPQGGNLWNAVCVKTCPKKGVTSECMINSMNTGCPMLPYDATQVYSYCMPEGDDMKDFVKQIYKAMD